MEEKTNYLVHYGVKGMKWRKRKQKALDIAWELRHPIRGATEDRQIIYGSGGGERVTRNENRRNVETTTYKMGKNGKWKKVTSQKVTKKKYRDASYTGKKALEKALKKAQAKRYGTKNQSGSVRKKGYSGNTTKVKGARGSNRKKTKGNKGW